MTNTHTQPFYGPFFRDHPGEPVLEENFWTLWCKGRLTEADTPTTRLGATPSRLTSAHLHHPIFTDRMPFLPPNQQCQSTEGNFPSPETWTCIPIHVQVSRFLEIQFYINELVLNSLL